MRIVVAGAIANKPEYGGEAWVRLAWVRGLAELGLDVVFVEVLHSQRDDRRPVDFFERVVAGHGLADRTSLLDGEGRTLAGLDHEAVLDHANGAELLVNLSGHLPAGRLFDAVRRRAYVDLDPGYTQIWHHRGAAHLRLAEHDVHFTVGTNVGDPGCPIPTGGLAWIPVLPPVLLDAWPASAVPDAFRFTTVASWRGAFGPVRIGERSYGPKAHEFRRILDLPRRVPVPLEIALDIHPGDDADRERLLDAGWILVDPTGVAATPEGFRDYLRGSGGELSAVQGVYAETASGWVSDRSAHYLASGRPVVVQDTGLGRTLPLGDGLLTFAGADEAAEAAGRVAADPESHGRHARRLAEEHFAAEKVLTGFLDDALAGAPPPRPRPPSSSRPPDSSRSSGPWRSRPSRSRPSVLVSGMVAGVPGQGGASWAVLQYLLGLLRLGHDVHLVEEVPPDAPGRHGESFRASTAASYFRRAMRALGLEGRATLLDAVTGDTVGLDAEGLRRHAARSEVLLDLSGSLTTPGWIGDIPIRVYLDLDPGFTQVWAAQGALTLDRSRHTHFATVGLEVGRPGCPIPTAGVDWIPTLPPVSLPDWPLATRPPRHGWTTVGHWRAYGSVEWNGERWGQKAHAVRDYLDLPARTDAPVEVALGIHEDEQDDLVGLREGGWTLLDPDVVARDPVRYRGFVHASTGELGITKEGYVRSRSGWFSDRSACYLAAGRPVVAHDTGFSRHLPTGEGLLAFATRDEAADAMAAVRADYESHRSAARDVAARHFAADRVLPRLLSGIDACVRPT